MGKDLDKLCRYFDSVAGTDRTLMLVQYSSKLLIWILLKQTPNSPLATRIANLAGPVSDFRILLRYYGLLPLIKSAIAMEKQPPSTPRLQFLARLQHLANLCYYPLEHAYWLALHHVIPMTDATRDKVGMWSCRFWAAYVVLYFAQLHEERRLIKARYAQLKSLSEEKQQDERKKLMAIQRNWNIAAIINSAYFPLTVHWSLEQSSFPDVAVGIFGTIAALAQIHVTWNSIQ